MISINDKFQFSALKQYNGGEKTTVAVLYEKAAFAKRSKSFLMSPSVSFFIAVYQILLKNVLLFDSLLLKTVLPL